MADEMRPNPLFEDGLPMSCRECFWYSGNVLNGLCHGQPRSPLIVGAITDVAGNVIGPRIQYFWSETNGDDFCAVFRPDRDKDVAPLIAVAPTEVETEEAA
jgi:hypothetical protein